MAADGAVGADLEVGPSQFVFDLLAALLDPGPQAVEADDLGEVGASGVTKERTTAAASTSVTLSEADDAALSAVPVSGDADNAWRVSSPVRPEWAARSGDDD